MDAIAAGLIEGVTQGAYQSTTPLLPGAQFASPWLDVSGAGDAPYFSINVSSDQAGSLQVFEGELESQAQDIIGGVVVPIANLAGGPGFPMVTVGCVNKRYLRFVYTNAAVQQTQFSIKLTLAANPALVPKVGLLDTRRVLELILRELRAQSMILAAIKEPGTIENVNIPFGPAPFSN